MLSGYDRVEATPNEAQALMQGKQYVLLNIIQRAVPETSPLVIFCAGSLVAIASKTDGAWGLDRVFTELA
jgi:hypothetical protein